MSCEICQRSSCTRSFHSIEEQERFDAVYSNGQKMFAKDGTMLDENGNRSIFDDVEA